MVSYLDTFEGSISSHVCLYVATLDRAGQKPPWLWSISLFFSADIGSSTSVKFSAFLNGHYLPADLRGEITVSYNSPTGKWLKVTRQRRIVLSISGQLLTDCLLRRKCVLHPVKPSSSPRLLQASVSRPSNISGIYYFPLQTNKTTLYFECQTSAF